MPRHLVIHVCIFYRKYRTAVPIMRILKINLPKILTYSVLLEKLLYKYVQIPTVGSAKLTNLKQVDEIITLSFQISEFLWDTI